MQFLYPGFLWGLLVVGLPIVVHLLQLRRPQRLLFTNTGFIREVELTTMRRRRVEELLILAFRVLSIVFLVLVFAQPFISAFQLVQPTSTVDVALDNSLSMQMLSEEQVPLLQEAVKQMQALGKSYDATTRFRIVGQPGGELTKAAYADKSANILTATRQQDWKSVAFRQQLQNSSLNPLYILSDFQLDGNGQWLKSISKTREIVLVPQKAKPVANIYADSVWLDDAFVRARVNLGLHVRLRNGGTSALATCPVKVKLGGQQVATFSVSLNVGQTTTVVTQVQLPDARLALGQVVTEDVPVVFDNTYYFALQPTAVIRVLEIGAEPVAQKAYSVENLFAYSFAQPNRINYSELRRANLVLVNGVASAEAGLREALAAVVRRGGSIVVVPTSDAAGRTATLQLLGAVGVGGVQWQGQQSGAPALQELAMPSARDPFFQDVFGAQPRQVVLPQVAPVLQLGRGGTDILRLRDGESYLAEYQTGNKGRIYVFTAPFAKAYGDFTAQGLFVPVMYRLAMLSYRTSRQPAYRLSDAALALEVPANVTTPGEYKLVHDSLTLLPTQRLRGTSLQLQVPAEMGQPGFYKLLLQGKVITTLAFNAARNESELQAYSAADLRQLIGPGHPNVRVLDSGAEPTALLRYRAAQTGQPLWRYCLLLVLVCLLAEGLLLRFGSRRLGARVAAG